MVLVSWLAEEERVEPWWLQKQELHFETIDLRKGTTLFTSNASYTAFILGHHVWGPEYHNIVAHTY